MVTKGLPALSPTFSLSSHWSPCAPDSRYSLDSFPSINYIISIESAIFDYQISPSQTNEPLARYSRVSK